MTAENALLKARASLLMDDPFFGTLALKLVLNGKNEDVKTMATDGRNLFYNEKWVQKHSQIELKGTVAHEVMHVALLHFLRRMFREHKLWNISCDYAINPILIAAGFILPHGALVDKKYKGMSAEQIYALLKDAAPEDTPKPCAWGGVMDADTSDGTSTAQLESEWQVAVTQAAQVASQAGKMPGHLQELIRDIINPVVDWRAVLWPFFTSRTNEEYTWAKPNRAYISEDEYLPSLHNHRVGEIAIIIDSSGSTQSYYELFMSEMAAIHGMLRPEKIIILHCDYIVQKDSIQEIEAEDDFPEENKIYGGGGTAFAPAFDYLNEHHPNVEAAVYLTDLESSDFGEQPNYPVLWVTTGRDEAPWGETTYIQLES